MTTKSRSKAKAESHVCFACGASMRREERAENITYKTQSLEFMQPGLWCMACDEAVFEGSDLKATERLVNDFRARVDGLLVSSDVRRIRKKLKLTQAQAGDLFGGGHNGFSRYERGERSVPKALDFLLRLLDENPVLLDKLREDRVAGQWIA